MLEKAKGNCNFIIKNKASLAHFYTMAIYWESYLQTKSEVSHFYRDMEWANPWLGLGYEANFWITVAFKLSHKSS